MRLDDKEKRALKYSLAGFNGDVYLFGSRLDDAQKGGDIDLLLVLKQARFKDFGDFWGGRS